MIDLIMLILVLFLGIIPIAIIGNKVGEKLEQWLNKHFPDIDA